MAYVSRGLRGKRAKEGEGSRLPRGSTSSRTSRCCRRVRCRTRPSASGRSRSRARWPSSSGGRGSRSAPSRTLLGRRWSHGDPHADSDAAARMDRVRAPRRRPDARRGRLGAVQRPGRVRVRTDAVRRVGRERSGAPRVSGDERETERFGPTGGKVKSQASRIDGNAVAGTLGEIFVHEMTAVRVACGGCGKIEPIGAEHAYRQAPGIVLRCCDCDAFSSSLRGRERVTSSGSPGRAGLRSPNRFSLLGLALPTLSRKRLRKGRRVAVAGRGNGAAGCFMAMARGDEREGRERDDRDPLTPSISRQADTIAIPKGVAPGSPVGDAASSVSEPPVTANPLTDAIAASTTYR